MTINANIDLAKCFPCPFCGSEKITFNKRNPYLSRSATYKIRCKSCGGSSGGSIDVDKVVAKWNRRERW